MIQKISNTLYFRDLSHDVAPQTGLVQRVCLAAVPFLSFHRSLHFPVSVGMGALRIHSSKERIDTTLAIIALAATIFHHRLGMMATAMHDLLIEIRKIRKGEDREEILKSLAKILNSLIYLVLISQGGLPLSIAAFTIQAVVSLIQSKEEFKNDRWIEGVANLLLAAIQLHRSHTQFRQLKRNWELESTIKRISPGGLSSDHLLVDKQFKALVSVIAELESLDPQSPEAAGAALARLDHAGGQIFKLLGQYDTGNPGTGKLQITPSAKLEIELLRARMSALQVHFNKKMQTASP